MIKGVGAVTTMSSDDRWWVPIQCLAALESGELNHGYTRMDTDDQGRRGGHDHVL
jgi:hypothetical protein